MALNFGGFVLAWNGEMNVENAETFREELGHPCDS